MVIYRALSPFQETAERHKNKDPARAVRSHRTGATFRPRRSVGLHPGRPPCGPPVEPMQWRLISHNPRVCQTGCRNGNCFQGIPACCPLPEKLFCCPFHRKLLKIPLLIFQPARRPRGDALNPYTFGGLEVNRPLNGSEQCRFAPCQAPSFDVSLHMIPNHRCDRYEKRKNRFDRVDHHPPGFFSF